MATEITRRKSQPADAATLHQVTAWILSGASEFEIIETIATKYPDAKARPLILTALKQIAKQGTPDISLVKGFCIEGTRSVYQQAMQAADFPTALRALKQLAQLAER